MPGNRRSIRLKNYDYAQKGVYYVTVCANDRKCLFGDVRNKEMVLNGAGKMVEEWWQKLPKKYDGVEIDQYCVMPNHIHGIIRIVGAHPRVRPDSHADGPNIKGQTHGSAPTVGTIIQWFKTMSTNEYIRNVKTNNWPPFNKHFWQRNFYEHVIRDDSGLTRIREYIINNPARWEEDEYYSLSVSTN